MWLMGREAARCFESWRDLSCSSPTGHLRPSGEYHPESPEFHAPQTVISILFPGSPSSLRVQHFHDYSPSYRENAALGERMVIRGRGWRSQVGVRGSQGRIDEIHLKARQRQQILVMRYLSRI